MASITVVNANTDLSGNTLITEENAYTITGLHTFSRSTNAPFAVNSGAAVVANLDADKLDGQQGSHYLDPANLSSAVAVNKGGTGATSLTDGGVLLGSGTSAITATAVLGDGVILIGDGSGDPTTLDVGSSTAITTLGTIATGVWEGTDVGVAHGGTGVSTLTDGGVLLGNGTGNIQAMAVLADGEMIVGDGTTDPVAESGADLRTSIGVGTGNSPQFTGVELGHATDTTIARASAGNVTIEGNEIYRAGGTDVPVADGGTGRSTLTDGGILIGKGTAAINQMAVLADGEMIVGDGTTDPVAETGSTLRASIGCDAAGNITSGTVATARLGSGTASSGTFLRGDSSWAAVSATSAAGSDTQVQYNDGGSSFGGDAGLVYNDSTDLLTTGKLATTDTGTRSIDVAGGITAGTGNVALVGVDGKIQGPLSTTIIDDLSGTNLTTLNASALSAGTVATARLGTGTASSGTFLRGDGTWAAAGGSYKILQVHNFSYTAQVGSTSSTFATTNVLDKITLADTDNKVLVMVDINGVAKSGNTSVSLRIQRAIDGGATTTVNGGNIEATAANTASTGTNYVGSCSFQFLDNPTTTSELTYTVEFANASNASNTYVMVGNSLGSITLMEVEV